MITDPNCIRNWDPDMTFRSSSCSDVTMVSCGITVHPIHYSPCENKTLRHPHVLSWLSNPRTLVVMGAMNINPDHGCCWAQTQTWPTDTVWAQSPPWPHVAGHPDLHDIGLAWFPDTNIATGDHPYPGLLYSLFGTTVMYINTELNYGRITDTDKCLWFLVEAWDWMSSWPQNAVQANQINMPTLDIIILRSSPGLRRWPKSRYLHRIW